MNTKKYATLAAVTLAASAAFTSTNAAPAGCNNPAPQKQEPGFWDKAASIGGKIAGDVAGGVVKDATRGLGNSAGKAVREASGDLGKHTRSAQREARNAANQASRAAQNAAKNGARGAVEGAKGAFEDCSTPRATPQSYAPATAPQQAASAYNAGNAVGSLLKIVPGLGR